MVKVNINSDEISYFFDGWKEFNKDFSLMSDLSPEKALFIKLCRLNPYLLNNNMPHVFTERLKKLADLTFDEFIELDKKITLEQSSKFLLILNCF